MKSQEIRRNSFALLLHNTVCQKALSYSQKAINFSNSKNQYSAKNCHNLTCSELFLASFVACVQLMENCEAQFFRVRKAEIKYKSIRMYKVNKQQLQSYNNSTEIKTKKRSFN